MNSIHSIKTATITWHYGGVYNHMLKNPYQLWCHRDHLRRQSTPWRVDAHVNDEPDCTTCITNQARER